MKKTIHFSSGPYLLYGTLHMPAIKNPPVVIGSHGLLSTGESPKQIALAKACNRHGMAYFRYDHRGCGNSEGKLAAATTFEGRCQDLSSAIQTVRDLAETSNEIALFGSSFGGAISLALAGESDIASIVTVAAPLCSDWIHEPYVNDPENIPVMQKLQKDKLFFDIRERISDVSHLLIFHGDKDEIVALENALELNKQAKDPKMLICQKSGDHQMSDEIHQKEFIDRAVAWFFRYFQKET